MRTNAKPSDLLRFVDSSLNCNILIPNYLYPCHLIPSCLYRCLPQSAIPSMSHLPSHLLPMPTLALAPVSCLIYLHKKIVRTLLLSFSASSFWPLVIYSMKCRRCQWSSSVKHYSHKKRNNFKMAENLQKFRLDDTNAMRTLEVNPRRVIPTASPDVCLNINGFTPLSTTAQSPLANRGCSQLPFISFGAREYYQAVRNCSEGNSHTYDLLWMNVNHSLLFHSWLLVRLQPFSSPKGVSGWWMLMANINSFSNPLWMCRGAIYQLWKQSRDFYTLLSNRAHCRI